MRHAISRLLGQFETFWCKSGEGESRDFVAANHAKGRKCLYACAGHPLPLRHRVGGHVCMRADVFIQRFCGVLTLSIGE